MTSITFVTQAGSRKCWPKRFRGLADLIRSALLFLVFATPVALLDFFDLLFAQAEVVPNLVNQRLCDRIADVIIGLAVFLDNRLEQRDAIRERVAVAPRPFGQRRALIETVKRIGRLGLHLFEQLRARFVLDDDGDVRHLAAKAFRDERDRLSDELFEFFARHAVLWRSPTGSSRNHRGPNIDRTAVWLCRCAGRGGSVRPSQVSTSPLAARGTTDPRP